WWEKKLRDVATIIAADKFAGRSGCLTRSFAPVGERRAAPYHSPSFNAHGLLRSLPSVQAARRFGHEVLVPAAAAGKTNVIVTRRAAGWELPHGTENLIIYQGGQ